MAQNALDLLYTDFFTDRQRRRIDACQIHYFDQSETDARSKVDLSSITSRKLQSFTIHFVVSRSSRREFLSTIDWTRDPEVNYDPHNKLSQ